jgi:hypothetical protein
VAQKRHRSGKGGTGVAEEAQEWQRRHRSGRRGAGGAEEAQEGQKRHRRGMAEARLRHRKDTGGARKTGKPWTNKMGTEGAPKPEWGVRKGPKAQQEGGMTNNEVVDLGKNQSPKRKKARINTSGLSHDTQIDNSLTSRPAHSQTPKLTIAQVRLSHVPTRGLTNAEIHHRTGQTLTRH